MKFGLILLASMAAAQSWVPQDSGTTSSLRGVSAVSATVVWASGTDGTFLRTTDGGAHWRAAKMPGASDLDFRGIVGIDENTAYLMSAGEGEKSRIYKTVDGGERWSLLYTNPDPKGFFDAIAFWDASHGIVLGDPVKGHFYVLNTSDGGTWKLQKGPSAQSGECAFAGSNTCLFALGTREAWFGTSRARVFHTTDAGETWSVSKAPLRKDSNSAGIFSLAFANKLHGIAVGGDYHKPSESTANIAVTADGGKSWSAPSSGPNGYRSAIVYVPALKAWIATGTSGSEISFDAGATWKQFDTASYNAMSFSSGAGWAVGPKGAIAKWQATSSRP